MANKIVGTKGDDVLKGTKGKDIIKGKGGNDIIIGKKGNDVLKGGKGDDELKGGKGNDDIKGGKGEDLLIGGKGSDDHWGGGGADIFKFKNGDGFYDGFPGEAGPGGFDDIIWDYEHSIDKLDVPVVKVPLSMPRNTKTLWEGWGSLSVMARLAAVRSCQAVFLVGCWRRRP